MTRWRGIAGDERGNNGCPGHAVVILRRLPGGEPQACVALHLFVRRAMKIRIFAIVASLAFFSTSSPAQAPKVAASMDPAFLRAVAGLRSQIASIKWLHDICVEQSPGVSAMTDEAFADWTAKHVALASEVESSVRLIDRQTTQFAQNGAGLTRERMNALLSQTQTSYRKQILGEGPAAVAQRCSVYKSWTQSSSTDPQATHADWVAKMRQYAAQ